MHKDQQERRKHLSFGGRRWLWLVAVIGAAATRWEASASTSATSASETLGGTTSTSETANEAPLKRTLAMPWIEGRKAPGTPRSLSSRADWPEEVGMDLATRPPIAGQNRFVRFAKPKAGGTCDRLERSEDGLVWTSQPLPESLVGSGHGALPLPGGRWVISLVDTQVDSPTQGAWVAWVGTLDDLWEGKDGAYTALLMPKVWKPSEVYACAIQEVSGLLRIWLVRTGEAAQSATFLDVDIDLWDARVPTRASSIPWVDLAQDGGHFVVVDREPGQYLGHVTTTLLGDGHTILAVYPKGHGKGAIVFKRSSDGGRTWSERLPTPASWATSREVPTIHRVFDPVTRKPRLLLWSGLYPARLAHSEDEGSTWSELEPLGAWGGIVVMGGVEPLRDGRLLALFHDDGRFASATAHVQDPVVFTLLQTESSDGGLHWSPPRALWEGSEVHLCEPGILRSPDGRTLAVLLRENRRSRNSFVIFSEDEAQTWSSPRELPASLTGDRHTGVVFPDGRVFLSFRDTTLESPTRGDWVGWVGSFEDLVLGRPGQYRVRLRANHEGLDSTYPGVVVLPDGTLVVTTYGHFTAGESPYIVSCRITLAELDALAAK